MDFKLKKELSHQGVFIIVLKKVLLCFLRKVLLVMQEKYKCQMSNYLKSVVAVIGVGINRKKNHNSNQSA